MVKIQQNMIELVTIPEVGGSHPPGLCGLTERLCPVVEPQPDENLVCVFGVDEVGRLYLDFDGGSLVAPQGLCLPGQGRVEAFSEV